VAPTYPTICGPRIGYLTAAAIWAGNADVTSAQTNKAPFYFYTVFDVTSPYPNSNQYPLYDFVSCPNPAGGPVNMLSGYDVVPVAQACGCTDWAGIATETATCQTFNSAWINQVLPKITWVKKGCPTCYTYQYDDKSVSFQGLSNPSTANAANGTDYTITFCPNNTSIPRNDSK
jgi:hypothetical protein